jgi:hypothetical protein
MPETDRDRIPRQRTRPIQFVALSGAHWGAGADLRSWHVSGTSAGWRLEFFDVEDEEPVPVGTYATVEEAKSQAEALDGGRRPTDR